MAKPQRIRRGVGTTLPLTQFIFAMDCEDFRTLLEICSCAKYYLDKLREEGAPETGMIPRIRELIQSIRSQKRVTGK
jgi:hypothetical protein